MTDLTLNLRKTLAAPIDTVFDAWLDPAMLSRFILPAPGMARPEVDNDPREGGVFRILMAIGDDKIVHSGTYLVIDRPHRLQFTWESPFSIDGSTVTIDFSTTEDGGTLIELGQVKFVDEEARANHEGGWARILEMLADVAA